MGIYKTINITKNDYISIFLFSLVTAFILSFNDWGYTAFSLNMGLINLQKAIIVSFVVFILAILFTKMYALHLGVELELSINSILTIVALLLDYVFYAIIPIPLFINFNFKSNEKIRYGQKLIMPNHADYAKIGNFYLNMVFFISLLLFLIFKEHYFLKFAISQFFFALPIPMSPGFYVLINGKKNIINLIKRYSLYFFFALIIYYLFK